MPDDAAGAMADLAVRLKRALRGMPGPVALITTRDPVSGEPAGLAASSVIAVSMDPPSMLVCVNRTASAHGIIEAAGCFCINLIGPAQIGLVAAFADSGARANRFSHGSWHARHGMPYLADTPVALFCQVRTTLLFGTHEAFVGEVFDLEEYGADTPLGWVAGGFAQFTAMRRGGGQPPAPARVTDRPTDP